MPEPRRTVLITGCSSGIGKALAREFHQKGYDVIAGARRVHHMDDLKAEGVKTVYLDVTDQDSIEKARKYVEAETGGRLDMLFNNAGVACTEPATDLSIDRVQECFAVNVFGVMSMVRAFAPMVIAAKGTIANTGSVAAIIQFPYSSAYSASKAALHQYLNCLRLELAPFGVKVVTVVTAAVKSNLSDAHPLPEGSLYTALSDSVKFRAQLSMRSKPMSAEDFSKRVYTQVTKRFPKAVFWEGSNWLKLWVLFYLIPRKIADYVMMRKFKLVEYFSRLKSQKPIKR